MANASGKVYEMRVLSVNDSVIECGLAGGTPGNFDVMVTLDGFGDIPPVNDSINNFAYELVIDSISPISGSYYGGTLITILGRNFSPEKEETQVFIRDIKCDIESVKTGEIQCRTPPFHEEWANKTTHELTLYNRLII